MKCLFVSTTQSRQRHFS